MKQALYQGYRVLAGLFLAGAVLQFFLAGLGVFVSGAIFETHATIGIILWIASVVLLVLAGVMYLTGGLSRAMVTLTALLVVLMTVQWTLVEAFSEAVPVLSALHPVNGLLVLGVAYELALGRVPTLPTARRNRERA